MSVVDQDSHNITDLSLKQDDMVSKAVQTVHLQNQKIDFAENESIHTESSYKYSINSFQKLCTKCGFKPVEVFEDKNNWFSVHYLEVT